MQCVSTTSFSIAVNGDLYGFFPGKSGVWQGDPLSPYLFIYCMEYLSRMLILACMQPGFWFHPKCGIHGISHLAFADDVLLLYRGITLQLMVFPSSSQSLARLQGWILIRVSLQFSLEVLVLVRS
jgi:hypothetical protein